LSSAFHRFSLAQGATIGDHATQHEGSGHDLFSDRCDDWRTKKESKVAFVIAWLLCLMFYFLTYALRSAPGVVIPRLSAAFGIATLGISSPGFAVIASGSLDRYGARLSIALGMLAVAAGSALFPIAALGLMGAGTARRLQGVGAAFAFAGAAYLAPHGFSARWLATVIGFTQAAGLLGSFAGQFAVGPFVQGLITWQAFWIYVGAAFAIIAVLFVVVTPRSHALARGSVSAMFTPYKVILTTPQSYLCGIVAGLGVPFLRQGPGVEAAQAIARSAMVPLGWVTPLLRYLADRWGGRKLMLISGIGAVYLHRYLPPYVAACCLASDSARP
jgi:MFS family permease